MNLKSGELCGECGKNTGGAVEKYQKTVRKTVGLSVDFPANSDEFDIFHPN